MTATQNIMLDNEFDDDCISEVFTQTCPECHGAGWVLTGHGHYGDCNGDAGEALKPCLSICDQCLGRGDIKAQ